MRVSYSIVISIVTQITISDKIENIIYKCEKGQALKLIPGDTLINIFKTTYKSAQFNTLFPEHSIHARGCVSQEKGFFGGCYSVNRAWFLLGGTFLKT